MARENRNEDIIAALESRKTNSYLLKSQKQHQYHRAIELVKSCRKPIRQVSDIISLPGWEKKITKPILREIEAVLNGDAEVNLPPPTQAKIAKAAAKPDPPAEYAPGQGTGAWAILITMYHVSSVPGYKGYMTKDEIVRGAQPHCTSSFTDPGPHGGRTAWNGVNTLVQHELVERDWLSKKGGVFGQQKDQFRITPKGQALAQQLLQRPNSTTPTGNTARRQGGTAPATSNHARGPLSALDLFEADGDDQHEAEEADDMFTAPFSSHHPVTHHHPSLPGMYPARNTRKMCRAGVCSEKVCDLLQAFLDDDARTSHVFKASKEKRKHLHQVVDGLIDEGHLLSHESQSVGNRRHLTVSKLGAGMAHAASVPPPSASRKRPASSPVERANKQPRLTPQHGDPTLTPSRHLTSPRRANAVQMAGRAALMRAQQAIAAATGGDGGGGGGGSSRPLHGSGTSAQQQQSLIVDPIVVDDSQEENLMLEPLEALDMERLEGGSLPIFDLTDNPPGPTNTSRPSAAPARPATTVDLTTDDFDLLHHPHSTHMKQQQEPAEAADPKQPDADTAPGPTRQSAVAGRCASEPPTPGPSPQPNTAPRYSSLSFSRTQPTASLSSQGKPASVLRDDAGRQQGPDEEAAGVVCLIVDDKERKKNNNPRDLLNIIKRHHDQLPHAVETMEKLLPLGDYLWVRLQGTRQVHLGAAPSEEDVAAAEEEDEDILAASVVQGVIIERKTINDLVGRSAGRQCQFRQLRRMRAAQEVVPYTVLLVEGPLSTAEHLTVYGGGAERNPGQFVMQSARHIYELVHRLLWSGAGYEGFHVLFVPDSERTGAMLAAMSVLLAEGVLGRQRGGLGGSTAGLTAGECRPVPSPGLLRAAQGGAAGDGQVGSRHADGCMGAAMEYQQFKSLCNRQMRQLGSQALPAEIASGDLAPEIPLNSSGGFLPASKIPLPNNRGSATLHFHTHHPAALLLIPGESFLQCLLDCQIAEMDATDQAHVGGAHDRGSGTAGRAVARFVCVLKAALQACGNTKTVLVVEHLWNGQQQVRKKQQKHAASSSAPPSGPDLDQLMQRNMWVWILQLMLVHGWHIHLAETKKAAEVFVQTACNYLASRVAGGATLSGAKAEVLGGRGDNNSGKMAGLSLQGPASLLTGDESKRTVDVGRGGAGRIDHSRDLGTARDQAKSIGLSTSRHHAGGLPFGSKSATASSSRVRASSEDIIDLADDD